MKSILEAQLNRKTELILKKFDSLSEDKQFELICSLNEGSFLKSLGLKAKVVSSLAVLAGVATWLYTYTTGNLPAPVVSFLKLFHTNETNKYIDTLGSEGKIRKLREAIDQIKAFIKETQPDMTDDIWTLVDARLNRIDNVSADQQTILISSAGAALGVAIIGVIYYTVKALLGNVIPSKMNPEKEIKALEKKHLKK